MHGRVGQAAPDPSAGRRRATQFEQQMQIMLSLPGIGPITQAFADLSRHLL